MKTRIKPTQPLTAAQRKRIFGYGKELGLDIHDLRAMAAQWTGKASIRSLNQRQADEFILRLQDMAGNKPQAHARKNSVPGMISPAQLHKIETLYRQYGWTEWQFRKWLSRYFKVDHERWLSASRASKVIEGLKAMIQRKQHGTQK